MIAELLVAAGCALILLSATGVVRFADVLERMHALSKASTMGLLLVMIGGVVGLDEVNDWTFVVLAGLLQLITSPVGANLISRATYRAEGIRHRVDTVDELADVTHRDATHPDGFSFNPRRETPGDDRPN